MIPDDPQPPRRRPDPRRPQLAGLRRDEASMTRDEMIEKATRALARLEDGQDWADIDSSGHADRADATAVVDAILPDIGLTTVLGEVREERGRQDAKWGEQNHPDGTGDVWEWQHGQHGGAAEEAADDARSRCQRWAARGECTYALILEEEVAEATAEVDPINLRAELIQVAAVAVAWVEAIDRRSGGVV